MQEQSQSMSNGGSRTIQALTGRFVFPYDAEDIKAHKWFRGVPWEKLHELDPPFVPLLRSIDDTQYFDDEEPITDLSDSNDEDEDEALPIPESSVPAGDRDAINGLDGAAASGPVVPEKMHKAMPDPGSSAATTINHVHLPMNLTLRPPSPARKEPQSSATPKAAGTPVVAAAETATAAATTGTNASRKRAEREALLAKTLHPFDCGIQAAVRSWLEVPYDSLRLRNFEIQVDAEPGLRATERDTLKALVRVYGKKEKKRPRDRLLRDPATKRLAMEVRKKTAFIGYDWKRIQAQTLTTTSSGRPSLTYTDIGMPIEPLVGIAAGNGSHLATGGGPSAGGRLEPPPGFEHLAPARAFNPERMSIS